MPLPLGQYTNDGQGKPIERWQLTFAHHDDKDEKSTGKQRVDKCQDCPVIVHLVKEQTMAGCCRGGQRTCIL